MRTPVSARRRRVLVGGAVSLTLVIAAGLFVNERRREQQELQSALAAHAAVRAQNALNEIEEHLETLAALADWYRAQAQAGRGYASSSALARVLQARNDDLFLLAEARRTESDGPSGTARAGYRVQWVEPPEERPLAVGSDLTALPLFAPLVARVSRTGRLGVSSRVPCPEEGEAGFDVWLLQPLLPHEYEEGIPEGGEPPAGILVAVLDVDDIMERALGELPPEDLSWRLTDEGAPPGEEVLYATGSGGEAEGDGPVWRTDIQLSVHKLWRLSARPGPAFIGAHVRWRSVPMLLGGISFALFVGLFLTSVLGRTEEVENQVRERTERLTREIADREEAQARLQESEGRYRALAENAEDLIYVAGLDDKIVYVNAHAARCVGMLPEELVGTPVSAFTPDLPAEEDARTLAQLEAGQAVRSAFPVVLQGKDLWLDFSLVPLKSGSGRVTGYMGIGRDMTERMQMEEQLRRAKDDAEAAAQAKADFLATMSHEIRTPLNGVIGTVGLLLDGPLSEKQRELAGIAHESATILLSLINEILDFSKIEAQRLALEPISFDPGRLLDEVAALFGATAAAKGIELATDAPAGAPRRAVGDSGRIRQVLMNLAGNAVKFTDRGRVLLGLAIEEEADGAVGLRYFVEDSGCGIAEELRGRLFERFVQGDASTTRRHGGTGLGLAISRKLVELMGGSIGVESRIGVGSTFWFRLALPLDTEGPVPASPDGAAAAPALPAIGLCRVLVAEDNAINQRVAVLMLESLGCRADVAANGAEAVAMVRRFPYDLVLMDCEMPEMDGFEASREIRRVEAGSGRRLRIVAMTARVGRSDRERCLGAGMDDFLSKPVSPQQLAAVLTRCPRSRNEAADAIPAAAAESAPGPAASITSAPAAAIDLRRAAELRRLCGGAERWEYLAALFESGVCDLLRREKAALASGDAEAMHAAAHKLKGSCANFGAFAMAGICARLDERTRGGAVAGTEGLLAELEAEWGRVQSALGEQRSQRAGEGASPAAGPGGQRREPQQEVSR